MGWILFSVSSFLAQESQMGVCKNELSWGYVIAAMESKLLEAYSTKFSENRKSPESPYYQAFRGRPRDIILFASLNCV
ncbi:MAG: hypothetical protein ACLR6S_03555 [Lacrimispora saccharolytica]